ncbi:restriction endonuclease subunit S [Agriterribacter humi]|uniref:restriction endonuclease subunit S n=1 Tax=Agriterribacter humi TaxID=1104781 RepID=UPI00126599D4|nr:restriction endonuclease subunit S [Agriterribacter humi]
MIQDQNIKQLPKGWKWVKVGEYVISVKGKKPKRISKEKTKECSIPYVNIKAFEKEVIDEYTDGVGCALCEDGDFLMVWDGSRSGYVGKAIKGALGSTLVKLNFPDMHNNYAYYFLQSKYLDINTRAKGVGIPHVDPNILWNYDLLIPPKPTQQAIVSKIEELFSELDKGIEQLKTAQQQLKTYRQAVLKWAFEGKLTEQWRNEKQNSIKGEEFVKQLSVEKEKQQKLKKIKSKPIPSIEDEELSKLPKLPGEFSWVRLGDLLWSVKDGPHYSPKYQAIGIPFISGGNIRPTGIDFSGSKFISEELHNALSQRCKPEKGDVLYTKGGTTGIARVNTYDIEFNVWVHVAVLKTLKSVNPFYLEHVLNSTHCYKQSQKYTHGVGNQDLGLTRMILITLPVCSFEEQAVIVEAIESRLSVADKMKESITESLQQAEALRQSILKKAFEGKLINQLK